MDIEGLRMTGIKALDASLTVCQQSLNAGAAYGAKSNFYSAIREFSSVIDIFPALIDLTVSLRLPSKTEYEAAVVIANFARTAYLGRGVAYLNIGEKEKGNADMVMAEKLNDTLKGRLMKSHSENYKSNNLSYTPVEEVVSQPKTQYTPPAEIDISQPARYETASKKSSDDDVSVSKVLIWTAVIFFVIVVAVASSFGISLSQAFLVTLGTIVALIIWIASR